MQIRPLSEEDLEKLAELERESFSDPWNIELLGSMQRSPYDIVQLAQEEGEIAGYLNLRILGEEAELLRIAVRSDRRKSGLASTLLEEGLLLCRERGVRRIFLEVRESNEAAIRLYQKYGFSKCGLRKEYYDMPSESALIMEYEIC